MEIRNWQIRLKRALERNQKEYYHKSIVPKSKTYRLDAKGNIIENGHNLEARRNQIE